jgi:hypothetical protein
MPFDARATFTLGQVGYQNRGWARGVDPRAPVARNAKASIANAPDFTPAPIKKLTTT